MIQYISRKYSRTRAALAAAVTSYRPRSAIRDSGKALGIDPVIVDWVAKEHHWFDSSADLKRWFAQIQGDVTISGRDSTMEGDGSMAPVRLGMSPARGMREETARRIEAAPGTTTLIKERNVDWLGTCGNTLMPQHEAETASG